jgi:antitoxin component YwqK of YwqJK toxin-antitoxin module
MDQRLKSESVYRVDLISGEEISQTEIEGTLISYQEYDRNGNIILEERTNPDGSFGEKYEHKYNDQGQLIESILYDEEDEILERKTITWISVDKASDETTHYLDGSSDTLHYIYDTDGKLIEKKLIDDEDELEMREVFEYNDGKLIRNEKFDGSGESVSKYELTYSDGGALTESSFWTSEGGDISTLVTTFFPSGRKASELKYNTGMNLVEKVTFEEDQQGRISRIIEEDPYKKNTTVLDYDEAGNLIRQEETNHEGRMNNHITRIFNESGNLVETKVAAAVRGMDVIHEYKLITEYEYFGD